MATCLIVQHAEPEGPYGIGEALRAAGVELALVQTQRGEAPPERIAEFDGLVVMGGPMSAAEDEGFPTRRHEMGLLLEAVDLEIPTLGVCLGAQLLAAAKGAAVLPGTRGPEIGWAPVQFTPEASEDFLLGAAPKRLNVLHWHGDTYELPAKAVHLAATDRYEQQAFRVGEFAWGLQFHVEVDRPAVDAFLAAFSEDPATASTTCAAIRDETLAALTELRPAREGILDRFAQLVARGHRG